MPDGPNYKVGYCKPPVGSRFQRGRSGNPSGRPKGVLNLDTLLQKALRETVVITQNGRQRRVSKMQVAVMQLVNRAASGDPKATQLLCQLVRHAEERSMPKQSISESSTNNSDKLHLHVSEDTALRIAEAYIARHGGSSPLPS